MSVLEELASVLVKNVQRLVVLANSNVLPKRRPNSGSLRSVEVPYLTDPILDILC